MQKVLSVLKRRPFTSAFVLLGSLYVIFVLVPAILCSYQMGTPYFEDYLESRNEGNMIVVCVSTVTGETPQLDMYKGNHRDLFYGLHTRTGKQYCDLIGFRDGLEPEGNAYQIRISEVWDSPQVRELVFWYVGERGETLTRKVHGGKTQFLLNFSGAMQTHTPVSDEMMAARITDARSFARSIEFE